MAPWLALSIHVWFFARPETPIHNVSGGGTDLIRTGRVLIIHQYSHAVLFLPSDG